MMYKGYAILMNTSLVTFTFGLGIPILFPISLLALINHYICEKILFAFIYRKPPMYGNQINNGCLNVLKYAPLLMMSTQYWAFTNKAIFRNESVELLYKNANTFQPHGLFPAGFDYSYIFLMMIPYFIFFGKIMKTIRYLA